MYMEVVQREPKQKTKLEHQTKVTSYRIKHEMDGMATGLMIQKPINRAKNFRVDVRITPR